MNVIYTEQAILDLDNIAAYYANHSQASIDRFFKGLDETSGLIADFPLMGGAAENIAPNARRFLYKDYLVFYRPLGSEILILRLVHTKQDGEGLSDV